MLPFSFQSAGFGYVAEEEVDPYYDNVVLLMNMDGTSFIDTSKYNHNVTVSGNTVLSSTQSKFGGKSAFFDASTDKLLVPPSDAFVMGLSDFTLELFVWKTAEGARNYPRVLAVGDGEVGANNWSIQTGAGSGDNRVSFNIYNGSSSVSLFSSTSTVGAYWTHIAVTRKAGVFKLWINGKLQGTNSSYTTVPMESVSTNRLIVGCVYNSGSGASWESFGGYIDAVRVTKGIARYDGTFHPPVRALPVGTLNRDPLYDKVSLLMHMNGANASTSFKDSSLSNKVVTAFGNAQISNVQSKFGGTSASFDGTGDYLSIGSSADLEFGTDNGTIEFFFSPSSVPSVAGGLVLRPNSTGYANFSLSFRSTSKIEAYMSLSNTASIPAIIYSSNTLSLNTWYHVAFVKNNLTYTLYVNGVAVGSVTASSHPPTGISTSTYIGSFDASNYFVNGYIDELRITKGIARYTGNFTPPTAPFQNY